MLNAGLFVALGTTALSVAAAGTVAGAALRPLPPSVPPAAPVPAAAFETAPAPRVPGVPIAAAAPPWVPAPGAPATVSVLRLAPSAPQTSPLAAAPSVPTPTPDRLGKSDAPAGEARLGDRVPAAVRRWEREILRAAREHGLDPNLLAALMEIESGGNPTAVSPANAVGLMQIMGGPAEPEANVRLGARMLAENLRRYDGDLALALAAYNAGPGNVRKYGGVPPFPETKKHVARTLAAYARFGSAPLAAPPAGGAPTAAAA